MGLQAPYSRFPTFAAVWLKALSCFSHLMLQQAPDVGRAGIVMFVGGESQRNSPGSCSLD